MLRSVSTPNNTVEIVKSDTDSVVPSKSETDNIDLTKIFREFISDENRFQYDFFLNFVKQKQANAQFMAEILQKMKPLIYMLEPKQFEASLINLLFVDIKWGVLHSNNEMLLATLSDFLINLNSAYTSYIYRCLNMLIKNFLVYNTSKESLINCEALYKFSHSLIKNLIKIAPSCKNHLIKQIDMLYPYMTKDTLIQEAYILNVLQVTEYARDLRLTILEICIQKLLKVDVNCTREQISDAELNSQPESEQPENNLASHPETLCMQHPLADRLDIMMCKLFQFINKNSSVSTPESPASPSDDWEACKSIYKDLLFTFDKYILCTYGSLHAQFLMFYMCSFKSMLSEGFLDYLWKKFSNPISCQITKQICTYYIGSFLARAKYVHISTCSATLQLIVTWIHNYIEKFSNTKNYSNFDVHRTFYALCQTLFYVIIFRHKQLFGQNSDLSDLIKSWKLNEIVSSKLNPLRYCLPSVCKKFSRVAYTNQVAYCYSIIDANNRVSLPTTAESTMNKRMFYSHGNLDSKSNQTNPNKKTNSMNENPLDSFFPFDPYLLKRSKPFIEKHYQEFQSIIDEEMDVDSDLDDEDDLSDSEEDQSDAKDSEAESKDQYDHDSDIENSIDLKPF